MAITAEPVTDVELLRRPNIPTADVRLPAVRDYEQVDDEIGLMDGGAAELMNRFTLAGAKREASNGQPDVNAIISGATPEQALSFVRFVTAPEYTDLRKLAGIGDVFDPTGSAEQNEKRGERLGASLGATAMLKAVGACRIPMSALLAPQGKDS